MSTSNAWTRRPEQGNWAWKPSPSMPETHAKSTPHSSSCWGAKADGIITATDPIPLDRREQIVAFANRHKLPLMGFVRQFAAAGGLLSYGPSISWMYRQAGEYGAQILKGASPAELAVLQPTQFEVVINLKTANSFGLTLPLSLQATASEVIE